MSLSKSRNWTDKEDEDLLAVLEQLKSKGMEATWNQIAQMMKQRNSQSRKTGKQCRQRWANQLDPKIKRNQVWSKEQNEILFTQHEQLGNKWSQISSQIPGRTDNCVKNHFYSTMRRGLRKINSYIENIKRKNYSAKTFKIQILNKVLAICEGKNDSKYQFNEAAKELAFSIKSNLVKLTLLMSDVDEEDTLFKDDLFKQICQFSRNCRKKKTKKSSDLSQQSISFVSQKNLQKDKNQVSDENKSVQQEQIKMLTSINKNQHNSHDSIKAKKVELVHITQNSQLANFSSQILYQKKQKGKYVQKSQNLDVSFPQLNPFAPMIGQVDYFYLGNSNQEGSQILMKFPEKRSVGFINSLPDMFVEQQGEKRNKNQNGCINFMLSNTDEQPANDRQMSNFSQIIKSQQLHQSHNFNLRSSNFCSTVDGTGSGIFSYSPALPMYSSFTLSQLWSIPQQNRSSQRLIESLKFSQKQKQPKQQNLSSFRPTKRQKKNIDFSRQNNQ